MLPLGLNKLASMLPLSRGDVSPIGLDLGTQCVKALQLTSDTSPSLISGVALPVPEMVQGDPAQRLGFQLESIGEVLKNGAFKGRRVVCSLPGSHTLVKHVQVQPTGNIPLETLVAGEMSSHLQCDPAALMCRSIVVEGSSTGTGGRSEVIAITVARSLVARLMEACKMHKLQLVGLMPECLALLHGYAHGHGHGSAPNAKPDHGATLFLDLGASATKVYLAHDGQLVFAKTVQLGGRYLDQTIAKQANVSLGEARALRNGMKILARPRTEPSVGAQAPASDGFSAALQAAMRLEQAHTAAKSGTTGGVMTADHAGLDLSEPLDTLTEEVGLCLRYYESMFPSRRVARAIFVGGESASKVLCEHIAKALRLPASLYDPMARVGRTGTEKTQGVDMRQPQPAWAIAAGLCLGPTDV